jgi:hypothetical protein
VFVDETSGDLTPLSLERLSAGGTLVLQSGQAPGTGTAVSLRWRNDSSAVLGDEEFRVRSGGCGTDCGADDVYRIRAYETTLAAARWNNAGGLRTFLVLQNLTDADVEATALFWVPSGVGAIESSFVLAPRTTTVFNTSTVAPEASGSLTVIHTAGYGGLAGKLVTTEVAAGFSFDTPLRSPPR